MEKRMKQSVLFAALVVCVMGGWSMKAQAHCQIPCGIYDDHNRIHMMKEDIKTIAKAVRQIAALSKKSDAQSKNQLVRWVVNKEKHAERIIRIVSDYFLTQKIKAVSSKNKKAYNAYLVKLARHHAVMRAAMKTKQTVSAKAVKALTAAVDAIAPYWHKK
jgi:nickel superoxide dismutase